MSPEEDRSTIHIGAIRGVIALDLRDTGVTDTGLKELSGLRTLTSPDLVGTMVTEDGIDRLQKDLPKFKITSVTHGCRMLQN